MPKEKKIDAKQAGIDLYCFLHEKEFVDELGCSMGATGTMFVPFDILIEDKIELWMRDNEEFIRAYLERGRVSKRGNHSEDILPFISERLAKDERFVLSIWSQIKHRTDCIHPSLYDNICIVNKLVARDGMMLESVSDRFRDDLDIVTTAIKQNPEAIQFASLRLQAICSSATDNSGYSLGFFALAQGTSQHDNRNESTCVLT